MGCTAGPQKMARGLKLRIYKVEGLYQLCSQNKGADQLRGYHSADLRPCFSQMQKKKGFLMTRPILSKQQGTN